MVILYKIKEFWEVLNLFGDCVTWRDTTCFVLGMLCIYLIALYIFGYFMISKKTRSFSLKFLTALAMLLMFTIVTTSATAQYKVIRRQIEIGDAYMTSEQYADAYLMYTHVATTYGTAQNILDKQMNAYRKLTLEEKCELLDTTINSVTDKELTTVISMLQDLDPESRSMVIDRIIEKLSEIEQLH